MIIAVDMDQILVSLNSTWFAQFNDPRVTEQSVTRWDFKDVLPDVVDRARLFTELQRVPFAELDPIPGGIEAVRELRMGGHDVVVVTDAMAPEIAAGKMLWMRARLPELPRENLVITKRKSLINADVLIDDSPEQLAAWRLGSTWTPLPRWRYPITMTYPYNRGVQAHHLGDWRDPLKFWGSVVDYISSGEVNAK